jgi:hypothetical protein
MTLPKRRNAAPLSRRERALLRALERELQLNASPLPSDHVAPKVRIVLDLTVAELEAVCAALAMAGAVTAVDERGRGHRLGAQFLAGGMTPRQAARSALILMQRWGPPESRRAPEAAISSLAAELSRKRPRVKREL